MWIYLYAIMLVLLNTIWLGLTLVGLPGNWLMITTAALLTWLTWQGDRMFSLTTLGIVIGIALLAEVIEFIAGMAGARKAGGSVIGSMSAMVGGIMGAIVGTFAIPIPLLGTIAGAALGAFGGSMFIEMQRGSTRDDAIRVGRGAAIGHLTGTAIKFSLGILIYLTLAIAAFL